MKDWRDIRNQSRTSGRILICWGGAYAVVQPEGFAIRKALRWIFEKWENNSCNLLKISMLLSFTPLDQDFTGNFLVFSKKFYLQRELPSAVCVYFLWANESLPSGCTTERENGRSVGCQFSLNILKTTGFQYRNILVKKNQRIFFDWVVPFLKNRILDFQCPFGIY